MKTSLALASCALLLSGAAYASQLPTSCDVSQAVLDIPQSQNNITAPPSNTKPKYIGIALGIQNYTCSPSGNYEDAGQWVEILDISCLITDVNVWKPLRKRDTSYSDPDGVWYHEYQIRELLGAGALRLGTQYSVSSPGGGLSPYYDFRDDIRKGDPNGFMSAKTEGTLSSSNPDQDVAWSMDSSVSGDLATSVYRVDTHYGAAPKTCTPGSPPIQARYSAKYWFYDTPASDSSFKPGTSNALAENGSIAGSSPGLQKLLDYAPAVLGLLVATTLLMMLLVGFALAHFCRGRRSSSPMRSAAYRPVQLPRVKPMTEQSYHDEVEAYGA